MKITASLFSHLTFSYKNLNKIIHPWNSRNEFVQKLCENIVYNKDGLIAVNKFYGVPVDKINENKILQPIQPFNGSSTISIEESLPLLENLLQVKNLNIIKSTERYSSGILLLCSNEKIAKNVKKAVRRGKAKKEPYLIYWALVKGSPTTEFIKERIGIKLQEINGIKQPIISKEVTTSQIKKKLIKPILVECSLIENNKELSCSLVKLAVSAVKWHFLKVYMTFKASYILGDVFFSGRVREILGKSVEICTTNGNQNLPKEICQRLLLPAGASNAEIPLMLHLHSVVLHKYDHGKDLVITAPAPPHFLWACEKLGISSEHVKYLEYCK